MRANIVTHGALPLTPTMFEELQKALTDAVTDPSGHQTEIRIVVSLRGIQVATTKQRVFPWNA